MWNLWHGCHKVSEGCLHCYVFRQDEKHGINSSFVHKTKCFHLPMAKRKDGTFKVSPGTTLWTCFTSDFFIEEADDWRQEAWEMMKSRPDISFVFVTKRIHRANLCLPTDWEKGYDNVTIYCTVENQRQAELRLPLFGKLPARHKGIICEPILEVVNLKPWLGNGIEHVIVGGESGDNARPCNFDWVIQIRKDCIGSHVPFTFKQTGANFIKDDKHYWIARKDQMPQARKANMDYHPQISI